MSVDTDFTYGFGFKIESEDYSNEEALPRLLGLVKEGDYFSESVVSKAVREKYSHLTAVKLGNQSYDRYHWYVFVEDSVKTIYRAGVIAPDTFFSSIPAEASEQLETLTKDILEDSSNLAPAWLCAINTI